MDKINKAVFDTALFKFKNMKAYINKIIPLSTVDGKGLRTAVFFQKCNIKCLYCHNPETWNLCISCKKCVLQCPVKALSIVDDKVIWDDKKCILCDNCIKICPNHSSPRVKYMDSDEVFNIIKNNVPFIRGVTFSGGECSLNEDFIIDISKKLHSIGLDVYLDSNGIIPFEKHLKLTDSIDKVMLDVKAWDEEKHIRLTSFSNKNVKRNLKYLYDLNKLEEIRIVNVPGYVDVKEAIKGIKDTLHFNTLKEIKLKLITFRQNGVRGVLENLHSPSIEVMNEYKEYASSLGFKDILVV